MPDLGGLAGDACVLFRDGLGLGFGIPEGRESPALGTQALIHGQPDGWGRTKRAPSREFPIVDAAQGQEGRTRRM